MTKLYEIINYLQKNPNVQTKEVAKTLNTSSRHVRRAKAHLKKNSGFPKILLLDIETAPMEVAVWGLYKQRIPYSNKIKDWSVICWCAKWLYDSSIIGARSSGEQIKNRDDYTIMNILYEYLELADIVIAHNGNRFDLPKINTRFLANGLSPTSPYQKIDTYQVAHKNFGFSANSLDSLADFLHLPRKKDSQYDWWFNAAIHGDDYSANLIFDYCKQDIVVLEEVYTALRPWIHSHPNLGLYMDTTEPVCSNCGSTNLNWTGHYYTMVSKFKSFKCNNCGAVGRNRFSELSKEKRRNLVISTAR